MGCQFFSQYFRITYKFISKFQNFLLVIDFKLLKTACQLKFIKKCKFYIKIIDSLSKVCINIKIKQKYF